MIEIKTNGNSTLNIKLNSLEIPVSANRSVLKPYKMIVSKPADKLKINNKTDHLTGEFLYRRISS